MDIFFQDTVSYLLTYKYAALFFITFFAAFALPLPSTTSVMTAAGFASQGYLNIALVILFATLGNVVADNMAYWATRFFGESFLLRRVVRKTDQSSTFQFVLEYLRQRPEHIVFWSRFEVITTLTVNFLSGMTRIKYRTFFWYGLFGEAAQVSLFAGLGYFFGNRLAAIEVFFGKLVFLPAIVIFVLIIFFRKHFVAYLKKRKR